MASSLRRAVPVRRDGRLVDVRLELDGKTWSLVGRRGPACEEELASRAIAGCGATGLPVFLGAGLGVAVAACRAAGLPVAVCDREPDIAAATGARQALAGDDLALWIDDPDPVRAARLVRECAARHGRSDLHLLPQSVHLRLDPGYYGRLRALLSRPPTRPLFRNRLPRVLCLTSKLFLVGEVTRACELLGAPCHYLETGESLEREAYLALVRRALDAFAPDFVLTVNHLGVDREGLLLAELEQAGIPLASWFVDSPELILPLYLPAVSG